jgi:hypothetical protein
MDQWDEMCAAVEPHRQRVLDHEVYKTLDNVAALRVFMEHHVWAVWDFMSLLTALQRALTCTTVPWVPSWSDSTAQRFVNEIKLGEETDVHPVHGWCSHFSLYIEAMREVGANVTPIIACTTALQLAPHSDVPMLSLSVGAPEGASRFVGSTLRCALSGSLPEMAAAFALGREQLIPDLFRPLLDVHGFDVFAAYIERHIELDGGDHGPLSHALVREVCGHDAGAWRAAETAAIGAVAARHRLWNDTLHAIEGDGV